MKGFFRSLRYFAQVFAEEKEPEMEIGFPTDVKHVAHIGWEGPAASKPSWMNEIPSSIDTSNGVSNSIEELQNLAILQLPSRDMKQYEKRKHRSRRKSNAADSPRSNDGSKHFRRQSSSTASGSPFNSSCREPTTRNRKRHQQNSNLGAESPARDHSCVPKHSMGRKAKDSKQKENKSLAVSNNCGSEAKQKENKSLAVSNNCGSEAKDSKQNENKSLAVSNNCGSEEPATVRGPKNYAGHLSSVLEAYEEEV